MKQYGYKIQYILYSMNHSNIQRNTATGVFFTSMKNKIKIISKWTQGCIVYCNMYKLLFLLLQQKQVQKMSCRAMSKLKLPGKINH